MSNEMTNEQLRAEIERRKAKQEKIDALKAALESVRKAANALEYEKGGLKDAINDFVWREHRTNQQTFFKTVVMGLLYAYGEQHKVGRTDARNEQSCKVAHDMLAATETEQFFPFI